MRPRPKLKFSMQVAENLARHMMLMMKQILQGTLSKERRTFIQGVNSSSKFHPRRDFLDLQVSVKSILGKVILQ
jgi:hypothetical protein